MPKFFCEEKNDTQFIISGEDAKHISRVLRIKMGDTICVSFVDGYDYEGIIESINENQVIARITDRYLNQTEPTLKATLYQAIPKGDKFDFIVQKAVELGVTSIVPVLTKRCVSRPDSKSMEKKIVRWQKIAKEAAKQSGRGMVPKIEPMLMFEEAIDRMAAHEVALLFYEGGGMRINDVMKSDIVDIGFMIGSEGGFEQDEVNKSEEKGIISATLGKLILRCETAPLAALAIIMNLSTNI